MSEADEAVDKREHDDRERERGGRRESARLLVRKGSRRDDPAGDDSQDEKSASKDVEEQDDRPRRPMSRGRKVLLILLAIVVLGTVAAGGVLYWLHARQFESTDDATIDGNISQVASRVSGQVIQLAVADNQRVQAGQLLVALDARDFQVRLDQAIARQVQARSQLEQARAQVALQKASIDQSAAQVRVTEAELTQAQQDLARYRAVDPKAIARQQLDNAAATSRSAQARLDANRHALAAVQAQLAAREAQVADAQAALAGEEAAVRNAQLQLSYTRIEAPVAGRISHRTVDTGNYVNPGQVMLYVVRDGMWVTANFKETQLAHMQPGQPVAIQVDAVPDRTFHGHVDSFQAGSGSAFSTLPAENATGNYVKVVQRVPVKITLEDADDPRLAPGLSVVPRVRVR